MVDKALIADFTKGNVMRQLVSFASPLFLSNMLQIVYNMVDMVIVGQQLGAKGLSAISVGGDVSHFLTFMAMGFANAGQVIISQYIGAKRLSQLGRFVSTMFSFLMLCAIILSTACIVFRKDILRLMNTPTEAFESALDYATVSISGLVFIYGYNIVSAVMRGMGDSKRPFVFISIAAVLNVLLDLLFVMAMELGSGGAALATVISQGLSFILGALFIFKHRERYSLSFAVRDFFRLDTKMLLALVELGLPMAIKNASIHFSKIFVNSWINSYGIAVSAFAGVANKVSSMANLISTAFNTAGASMVGQNIGAGQYDRVGKIIVSIYKIMLTVALLLSAVFVFFPREVYSVFTTDESVLEIGVQFVPIACLLFLGCAGRSGMNALINGSGNYKVNFVTAMLDGIILRIGLALFFGLTMGMRHYGFWLGDALAGFTPLVVGAVFYATGKWKRSWLKS